MRINIEPNSIRLTGAYKDVLEYEIIYNIMFLFLTLLNLYKCMTKKVIEKVFDP